MSALSLCLPGTSSAADVLSLCSTSAPQPDSAPGCQKRPADYDAGPKLQIKAEASDHGFFWTFDSTTASDLALTTGPTIDRSIAFQADELATGLGELDVRGGVSTTKTSDALTFDRLRWGDNTRQDNTSIGIGVVNRLFDDRLTIAANIAWSRDAWTWKFGNEPFEYTETIGSARRLSVNARVVDSDDFKWSLTLDTSNVDDGFAGTGVSWQGAGPAFRGERTKAATTVAAFGATSTLSYDHIANRIFDRSTSQAKVDFDGVGLVLYARELTRFSLTEPGEWTSRSDTHGVAVDISPGDMAFMPDSPLVPQLLSFSIEQGHAATLGAPAEPTASYQVLSEWKTALGTTTALFWNELQGHHAGAGTQGDASQIIDISHAIRLGRWRLSVGATATDLESSDQDSGFADNAISGRFSVRYAIENGPQFEASLGRTHDEFDLLFDELRQRSQATRLSVSLDISDYVQRQLDRRDTRLTFEFRHELSEAEYEVNWGLPPSAVTRNTDTALISFSTPL